MSLSLHASICSPGETLLVMNHVVHPATCTKVDKMMAVFPQSRLVTACLRVTGNGQADARL